MAGSGCGDYPHGNPRRARAAASISTKARLVVSVGRGIGSKENIALAEQLCKAIGAELACSRPVAENEKWMEHERYVGISNLMLKPELYGGGDLRADPAHGWC